MNRKALVIVGVVVVLGILAAGAYTAVRLLAQPDTAGDLPPGARVMQDVFDDGSGRGPVSVRTVFLPAAELPDEPGAAAGIVLAHQDNTLTVGTGNIELRVEVEVDGATGEEQRSAVPSTDGPQVEVVITNQTLLYRDVTDFEANRPTESGERVLQQVVRQVESADEIKPQMEVQIWGEQRGDRIVADVVVFGPLPGA